MPDPITKKNKDHRVRRVLDESMDETGYVQPTIAELRNVRGTNSIYHNNRIQTWLVNPGGEVENVQVS